MEAQIISIYTSIPGIIKHIDSAWFVFNLFVIVDTTQGVGASVMRATGQQKRGAVITFLAYWIIGIPISCLLVYSYDMHLPGIWVGPTLACAFNTVAYLFIYKRMDLQDLVKKAYEQRQKDKRKKAEEDNRQALLSNSQRADTE